MPLHRRELLLTVGSSIALRSLPAGAVEPTHILVVGDSQAQGLAAGLQRQFRVDQSWRVIDRSHIATGLYASAHFDWPVQVQNICATEPGAIAVVMFGANDRPPVRVHGQIDGKLAAAFTTTYSAHVYAVAETLKRSCAAVIWVGHPIVRDPVYSEDMALLNKIFATQSVAAGGDWFSSWPLFADTDGKYQAYGKGLDGETTRLRADDGVHCTGAGYDLLAHALLPGIEHRRQTPAQPPA